ncbi:MULTISPECIES: ABC transporter permease [Nocardioides]|uniref:ABC transporter permease n=1 Tax=Nocardioides vastitatis TaxID=2568655 RepID=A0ABW0ZJ51_9ACTN|nr:ABC transporter permease [Nocardioides sp.]THJ06256.1 ABC transporter permease [Nocardioides sp.]
MVARELEAGTHRLIWTQSITRLRWLTTKLGLGMLGTMAAGALVSLAMTWWARPIDEAVAAGHETNGSIFELARIVPEMLGSRGIAPIGYAAFAFALGVAACAVLRRTVPAIAVTLVVYVLIQIVLPNWVRPALAEPERETVAFSADNLIAIVGEGPDKPIDRLEISIAGAGSWLLSSETVDASGEIATSLPSWVVECLPARPGTETAEPDTAVQACFDLLADEGYRQEVTSHPAGNYWPLQWRETGVMLLGALALSALAFWRVKRLS